VPEFDSVIPAGGSGTLTASVATKANQRGRQVKSIQVLTDADVAPAVRLQVVMEVHVPIEILPRPRLDLQAIEGGDDSATLVFRRSDGGPLTLSDPVSRVGAWVEFDVETVARDGRLDNGLALREGDAIVTARVRPGAEPVRRDGTLQLRSNHPQMPVLTVPVAVRIRQMIEVRPSEVRLVSGTSRPGSGSTIVRIVHNHNRPFRLAAVVPERPAVVQAGPATDGARTVHNVWIRLTQTASGEPVELPLRADVTVTLEGVDQRTITIPVVVSRG
jgi:hypothetical protein